MTPVSLSGAITEPGSSADVVCGGDDREVWYVAITDYPKGLGSTARSRSICTALRLAGRHPRLLIPYAIGHGSNERAAGVEDGVPYEYLNGSVTRPRGARRVVQAKLRFGAQLTRRLWRSRRRVSAVFLYNMSAFDAWPVVLAARLLRIPTVLDLTDEWHEPSIPIRRLGFARYCYQRLSHALEGVMFRGTDRIIVVTRHLERRLERYARKVHRLPMLFDPTPFEHGPVERPAKIQGPLILYAGSLSAIEGLPILIEALPLTDGAARRATLRIVGSPAHGDSMENYRALATRFGVSERVTFHPAVNRDRYAAMLRGADLLVIPRTTGAGSQAGFPYKLGEYLASGTPVVVTRFGDVEEYFEDRRHCLMAAPDDPAALASMLTYALEHPDEARTISRRGQARVRELFAFDEAAAVLERLLREISPGTADLPRHVPQSGSSHG